MRLESDQSGRWHVVARREILDDPDLADSIAHKPWCGGLLGRGGLTTTLDVGNQEL